MSAVFSSQALRQRHSQVSPLQWTVYGLVSLGSHVLLWGLLSWTLQLQPVGQPQGEPLAIDLIELDSAADLLDQMPPAQTKLSAAELNAAIAGAAEGLTAEGLTAEPQSDSADSLLGEDGAIAQAPAAESAQRQQADSSSPKSNPRPPNPPSQPSPGWFPWGQREDQRIGPGNSPSSGPSSGPAAGLGSLLNPQPLPATPPPPEPDRDGNPASSTEPPSANAAPADAEPVNAGQVGSGQTDAAGTPANEPGGPPAGSNGNSSTADPTEASPSQPETAAPSAGASNPKPPNMNPQPVKPDQVAEAGEVDLDDAPEVSDPQPGETNGGGSGPETAVEPTPTPSRFGASLTVNQALTDLENQKDPAQALPYPRSNNLVDVGNPSAQAVCTGLVNQLSLAEFGQAINIALEISPQGEVLQSVPLEPEGASPSYVAALRCLAEAWPFEPGVRDGRPATAAVVVVVSLELLP